MNPIHHPLVSVVVPAHNEAQHIGECVKSVLAQTYQNWECIIVDNCSTDGTGEIGRQYASKDPRICVRENKELLRAVANFNSALRQISSESKYCKIVFADDWIFPECLERMVAVAEEQPSVGIVGAYGLQGREVMWTGLPYPSTLVPGREMGRKLFLEDLYIFGTATSLLVRSSLVRQRNPFYNESNLHADSEVCLALLRTCDFGFVNQILTFTRVRAGSLTSFTNEINTLIAGRLHDLVTFGRDYLAPAEFEACMDALVSRYYDFLASNLTHRRDAKFWDYHKRKLNEAGVGFSRLRLSRAFLGKLASALLNPKDSIEKLLRNTAPSHGRAFEASEETRQTRSPNCPEPIRASKS